MTPQEEAIRVALAQLTVLPPVVSGIDREGEHSWRDEIILELLDVLAPEVAKVAREREETVGYWYA